MNPSAGAFALALDPWRVIGPMAAWMAIVGVVLALVGWGPFARQTLSALTLSTQTFSTQTFSAQTFSASLRRMARTLALGFGVLTLGIGAVSTYWLDGAAVVVHENSLEIRDFGTRSLDFSMLRMASLRLENLELRRVRAPVADAGAWHLPGYTRGWMILANGRKGWVMLPAGATKVVYISTKASFDLLLGVDDPQGLIDALKRDDAAPAADVRAH